MQHKVKKKLAAYEWNRRLAKHEYTERRITFGMHTGQMIKDLPIAYIKWGVLNLNTEWAEFFARELVRRKPKFGKPNVSA
jgi:hypothetical protein